MKNSGLILILLFFLALAANAEVTIATDAYITGGDNPRKNVVAFTSDLVGYVFYADASRDVVYRKTTDGGASWSAQTVIRSTSASNGPIIWFDKWTPGDSGNLIHVMYVDETDDDTYYVQFDTSDDSASTAVKINGAHTAGALDEANRYYISKATDGVLYAAQIDDTADSNFAVKCSTTCTSNGNWSDAGTFPFTAGADADIALLPLAAGDIMGINQKDSTGGMVWSIYDTSAGTWDATPNSLGTSAQNDSYRSPWGISLDPNTNNLYCMRIYQPFQASGSIDGWRYDGSSWTAADNLANSESQLASLALGVDGDNGDSYALEIDQNATKDVLMRKSDNSSLKSWGSYNYLSTTDQDNRSVSVNLVNDERIYAVWALSAAGTSTIYGVTAEDLASSSIGADSFSPADNSTSAGVTEDLVITFSEAWDAQTGNVKIKKTSENLLIENMSILDSKITGNGTTTLTINPAAKLKANTSYYVQIDSTAIDAVSGGEDYAGLSATTDWNFTTNNWYKDNWGYRIKLTVDSTKVNGDLSNFPVYVDLSDLSSTGFFTYVQADGDDIRVTKNDGSTEVAYDLVAIDTGSSTGELHFVANGTLSGSSDTTFYLYYGNAAATGYGATDTFGSENVWDIDFVIVSHMQDSPTGTVNDETSNSNDGTTGGTMTSGDLVAGMLGNGIDLDGTDDYISFGTTGESSDDFSFGGWMKAGQTHGDWTESNTGTLCNVGEEFVVFPNHKGTDGGAGLTIGTDGITVCEHGTSYLAPIADYDTALGAGWNQIIITYTSKQPKIYLNGYLVHTGTTSAKTNVYSPYIVGSSGAKGFNAGPFDEFRVVSSTRTAAWIETMYNNQNSASTFYSVKDEANPMLYQMGPSF